MRVAGFGFFTQATAIDLLEQGHAADHAGAAAARTGSQTGVGASQPSVNGLLAASLTQGRFESTGVHHGQQTRYVPEAQRGSQARTDRTSTGHAAAFAATASQTHSLTRPDPEAVLLELDVHAVQRGVTGSHTGSQDFGQTGHLEHCGTTLSVTSDGLLGDRYQRVTLATAKCLGQAGVQFRLVGVVSTGGGVVLGNHGDVVSLNAQLGQRLSQTRVATATARSQSTQARGRDGGVGAVGVRGDETKHCSNRQTKLGRYVTTGQDDGTATLGFHEAAATTVVST